MLIALALATLATHATASRAPVDSVTWIRINQVGYLPETPKVAVACSLDSTRIATFTVQDEHGRTVLGPRRAVRTNGFGPCVVTHRLDFTAVRAPGRYRIAAGAIRSPVVR